MEISKPLISKKRRITTTKLQRDQIKFRSLLLALDEKCVITEEATQEVLEAAHIIAASDGGTESVRNGIILRSDIHKLYDAHKFSISDDGEVTDICKDEISKKYYDLLKSKHLPPNTVSRVKEALRYKLERA